ncbi:MAG: hypothetical protein Q9M28_10815 [Mariprofundaceae bacterium]|nr:hypothetical protein [Mariprofundaceae bacterium]
MLNEHDFQKVQRRVGWFVILGITLVIGFLVMMSFRTDVFAKKFSLYVSPVSAASFHIGQAVRLHGFRVGAVHDIMLQADGTVNVQLLLLEKYRLMLHANVKARSIKEGFIGELSLELVPGLVSAGEISPDSYIGYESEVTIEKLLQDIKPTVDHAGTLLKEVATFSTWLNDPYGDLRVGVAHMRVFSGQLQDSQVTKLGHDMRLLAQELKQLTQAAVDQKTVENTNRVLLQTESMLLKLDPFIQILKDDGTQTVQKSVVVLDELDMLIQTLNRIGVDVEAATPQLPGLVDNTNKTVEDMRDMAKRLRASWLFSDHKEDANPSVHTEPVLDFRP